ncbi:carboxylesterase 5A-like [Styela clava]
MLTKMPFVLIPQNMRLATLYINRGRCLLAVDVLSKIRWHSSAVRMDCPVVDTEAGKVRGSASKIFTSKAIFSYRNLPYGRPPTGKRRFMPPEKALPWSGIQDCTMRTNIPMQTAFETEEMQYYTPSLFDGIGKMEERLTEDCLRLSIYTPVDFQDGKHPVMVWFYGGAFQMGFADMFDGTVLSALHDVVVVIPNYRVGVFGFFSLGRNSPCTGNAGLLDQRMALQWVQNNIEAFGGDKNNVTIFGESAGGCSVNHHVNSSMSSGLFHKAISHSGQSTLAKIFKRDLTRARENLLEILDINETDPMERLNKLQNIPAEKLVKADFNMRMRFMAFNPTIDGVFVHEDPLKSLAYGPANKLPYIIGCNNSEGQGMLTLLARVPGFVEGMTKQAAKVMLTNFLPRMSPSSLEECQDACIDFYEKDPNDKFRYSKVYGDIYTDSMFVAPAVTTAKAHTEAGCPVYFYYATYQVKFNHDTEYGPNVAQKPDWCFCDHSDDIYMMWGAPLVPGGISRGARFTEEEKELSKKCMRYITNFAKTGNPNVGETVDVHWPMYSTPGKYIELDHEMRTKENLLPNNVKFWMEKIPAITKKHENDDTRARL